MLAPQVVDHVSWFKKEEKTQDHAHHSTCHVVEWSNEHLHSLPSALPESNVFLISYLDIRI